MYRLQDNTMHATPCTVEPRQANTGRREQKAAYSCSQDRDSLQSDERMTGSSYSNATAFTLQAMPDA